MSTNRKEVGLDETVWKEIITADVSQCEIRKHYCGRGIRLYQVTILELGEPCITIAICRKAKNDQSGFTLFSDDPTGLHRICGLAQIQVIQE